ncbi:TetR/AcrR family transcriptional regulator [Mycobacterium sp. CVI_P3]|uniref:TetR/AcrR family transcriptional regulator n=1 Tax=Mycobacterium pinniadriaticum TaxID=2994102 RepID=A0ABT3S7T4_9MYCO|nr:TetR/AcrR family transcriptional regulator [Mycobacterium pinniadriaticum]MCX2929145.1 TetR/AcrR family transcriptional regulator [Mycobacterium pinniadriaticum]MCX2935570.1 TetR/AcrR family transcriptional regulator [Mycobacterium pinniadriaticum]
MKSAESVEAAAPSADRLPPNPRQRLVDALAASITDVGYSATTVADIVRRARTSRRTFYEYFTDREACLVALLADTNRRAVETISAAVDPRAPWEMQIRQAVEAWVANAESQPAVMLSWIRDVPALGMAARELQRQVTESFIAMVATLSDTEELRAAGIPVVSRQRALMLIGGLRELTAVTVESGGRMSDITDEAVDAAIALLGPGRNGRARAVTS